MNQIFDPFGFTCPAALLPKLILQETWIAKMGWYEELPKDSATKFVNWCEDLNNLKLIQINSDMHGDIYECEVTRQLYVFCDASKIAYAAVVYLRKYLTSGQVSVQLLAAKSRLAPTNRSTIPRLELLTYTIATRLASSVKEALNWQDISCFYWSDLTTVLAWIKRNDECGTFVGNRVKEICSLSNSSDWRNVPGFLNPADLLLRGCLPSDLVQSRWWEGPR